MRIAFLMAFFMLSSQALAQVQTFTLSNGLKVLVKEDHRAPVAVSMVWYKVGSSDEPGGITGVSHALEHLMFKGTPTHPQGVFSKTISGLGGEENAFTYYDYTAYYEKIAAPHLAVTFELEADRMENLILTEEEFTKELSVIKEERRLRTDDNPQALTLERYLATAHLASPYHHPVIGWMSDLNELRLADAKAWYQNFYSPNNATLVVVGDVDAQNVHQLAEQYFGRIQRRPNFIRKKQTEPPVLGAKLVNVNLPAQLPLLMMGYTVPSLNTTNDAMEPYTLEVITGVLNAGDSARLMKNIVKKRHIASSVDAYYQLYTRYQTQFILFGMPAGTHTLAEVRAALLKEIEQLQKTPIDTTELARIKTQMIAEKTFEQDSIFGQAMELGQLETIGLGYKIADDYVERINAVTPQMIQAVATRYFTSDAMTEAQLHPLPQAKEHK